MIKRFLPLALLLAATTTHAVTVRFTLQENFDSTFSTEYPAGDKPDASPNDTPPAPWTASEVEAVTPTHALVSSDLGYSSADTTFHVNAVSGWIYGNDDSFPGWSYETDNTSDYTITGRVVTATQGAVNAKTGLDIRDSLDPGAPHCWAGVYSLHGALADCRTTADGTTGNGYFDPTTVTVPECWRWEVDRDICSAKFYQADASTTCANETWTEIHSFEAPWLCSASPIYFLLATSPDDSFDTGLNATGTFDQVSVSTASVVHDPGTVGFNPQNYPVDEDAGTVTVTVERTGQGEGALDLTATVNNGTAVAGTDFTSPTCDFDFADADTTDNTCVITITNRSGVAQGDTQFTIDLTIESGADTLINATATVAIADQDAGTGFDAMGPCTTILDGHCIHGVDWSTYLATTPDVEYRFVSNLNTSGTGSFDAAIEAPCDGTTLYGVIFTLSGTVPHEDDAANVDCDHLLVLFQTAPDPGFHIKGLKLIAVGTQQLWMHPSCFATNTTTEGLAGCYQIGASLGDSSKVVFAYFGCAFNWDACASVFRDTTDSSYFGGMIVYPLDLGDVEGPESILIGNSNGSVQNITVARTVSAHFGERGPLWIGETDGTWANNLDYNADNYYSRFGRINATGTAINVLSNLYMPGEDSAGARLPILFGGGVFDATTADFQAHVAGNRAFGLTDTTQADLIEDGSDGHWSDPGSIITGSQSTGFVATDIGAGDAGEQAFAALDCRMAGPTPGVRLPFYQNICDQIDNKFEGISPQGAAIGPASDIGYPDVAVNTCNPFVEDDCGAGKPALPPAATVTAEQLIEFANATNCAVQPAGATGCP